LHRTPSGASGRVPCEFFGRTADISQLVRAPPAGFRLPFASDE
jgi:hypothetical protein